MHTTPDAGATPETSPPDRRRAVVTILGALLVLALVRDAGHDIEPVASAQSRNPGAPAMVNPADQRNQMVHELERLNAQIEALRRQLETGRGVKVEVVTRD